MTIEVKLLYLKKVHLRYKKATKKEKSRLLTEAEIICEYSRKHLIRIMNSDFSCELTRRGRKAKYTLEDSVHLAKLWKLMRYMCSVRMVAAMPVWLEYYDCPDSVRSHLLQMSSATIDRLLRPHKKEWKKGKSGTVPNSFIKSRIPIELLRSKVKTPGIMEADLVVHCGNSLKGAYANTLTMTDLSTGWTENRAIWTKETGQVIGQIRQIRSSLPFKLIGFASDNGSEFINHKVSNYFDNKTEGKVKFVRRRPYRKNDNAHVEQKNDTHVRQLFGYSRFDNQDFISMMNDIYQNFWNPFNNFFCPAMKLVKKVRIGGKLKKFYDTPKTPYQRLLESPHLTDAQKANLKLTFDSMNPIETKNTLDQKMSLFNSLLTQEQKMGGAIELDDSA